MIPHDRRALGELEVRHHQLGDLVNRGVVVHDHHLRRRLVTGEVLTAMIDDGVLVEFVEAPSRGADLSVVSLPLGEMRVSVLHDGLFRLDGGAMFGVVPRTLWEKRASADDRNRIQLSMRPLLIEDRKSVV